MCVCDCKSRWTLGSRNCWSNATCWRAPTPTTACACASRDWPPAAITTIASCARPRVAGAARATAAPAPRRQRTAPRRCASAWPAASTSKAAGTTACTRCWPTRRISCCTWATRSTSTPATRPPAASATSHSTTPPARSPMARTAIPAHAASTTTGSCTGSTAAMRCGNDCWRRCRWWRSGTTTSSPTTAGRTWRPTATACATNATPSGGAMPSRPTSNSCRWTSMSARPAPTARKRSMPACCSRKPGYGGSCASAATPTCS